ncbi:MAG: hypothetical protein GEU94_07795 [Micromonosporaceae bacterium]|nr:hypothetical protein [Micromonosporaceae bacterium]
MNSAREEVLARIRAAIQGAETPEAPRAYRRAGEHSPGADELIDQLEGRLVDYRATVHRAAAGQVGEQVRAVLASALPGGGVLPGGGQVVIPPGLPSDWIHDAVTDTGELTPTELDGFAAVVTACAGAAAETGTIVLDGSPDQGRRVITLVPDIHVCVVRADQVVQTVPELLARLDPTRPLTFISGPSATSDIELNRVEGVHGPRHLHVILTTWPSHGSPPAR